MYEVGTVVLFNNGTLKAVITKVCDNEYKQVSDIFYEIAGFDGQGNISDWRALVLPQDICCVYEVGTVVIVNDGVFYPHKTIQKAVITKVCDNEYKHISDIFYEIAGIDEQGNRAAWGAWVHPRDICSIPNAKPDNM